MFHLHTGPFTKLVVDSLVNFFIASSLHDACPPGSVRGLDKSELELEICLRSPVSRNRNQKLPMMALFVPFLLLLTVQIEDVSQNDL